MIMKDPINKKMVLGARRNVCVIQKERITPQQATKIPY